MSTEYILDIRPRNNDSKRVSLSDEPVIIGSDHSADLCFKEEQLAPLHMKVRLQDEVLTITQLGQDDSTKLGRQKLKQGKMYIIDKGDKINLGSVKIIIRKEKLKEKTKGKSILSFPKEEKEVTEKIESKDDTKEKISSIVRSAAKDRSKHTTFIAKKTVLFERHLLPGIISRFISHTLSLLISICLLTYIADYFKLMPLVDDFFNKFHPQAIRLLEQAQLKLISLSKLSAPALPFKVPGPETFNIAELIANPLIFKTLITYFVFQLISVILFGVEFPLLLMGVRSEGNFFLARLKGVVRYGLGYFTFPFLIFDLPLLIKRRSFKEFITLSKLQYKRSGLKYTSVLFIAPLLALICLLAPFGLYYDILMPSTLITKKVARPIKKDQQIIYSSWDQLELLVPMEPKEQQLLIPSFKLSKKGHGQSMKIVDEASQTHAIIRTTHEYKYKNIFPDIKKLDPLFAFHSRSLATINNTKLSTYQNEAVELMEDILSFNIQELHFFIMRRGPFVYPYLKHYADILRTSGLPPGLAYNSHTGHNKTVLINKNKNLFLFLNDGLAQLSLSIRGKNKGLSKAVLNDLILKSKKLKTNPKDNQNKLNSLDFYNTIWLIGNNQEIKIEGINKQLIDHLLITANTILEGKQNYIKKHYLKMLSDLDKLFLNLDKDRQKQYEEVRLIANRIQKALKNDDEKFFKSNLNTSNKKPSGGKKKLKKKTKKKKTVKKDKSNAKKRKRKRSKNK